MNDASTPVGLARFLAQTDLVGQALLVALVTMSIVSWTLIAVKGIGQLVRIRR